MNTTNDYLWLVRQSDGYRVKGFGPRCDEVYDWLMENEWQEVSADFPWRWFRFADLTIQSEFEDRFSDYIVTEEQMRA